MCENIKNKTLLRAWQAFEFMRDSMREALCDEIKGVMEDWCCEYGMPCGGSGAHLPGGGYAETLRVTGDGELMVDGGGRTLRAAVLPVETLMKIYACIETAINGKRK